MEKILNHLLSSHYQWIQRGFTFDKIQSIRRELMHTDPFRSYGCKEINSAIGKVEIAPYNLDSITFLIIVNECEINFNHLASLKNLEYLYISRCCNENKLVDLDFSSNLNQLKHLNIQRNSISKIDELSTILTLEHINLIGNHIKDHSPLSELNAIKTASLSDVSKADELGILKSNTEVELNICITDTICYQSINVDGIPIRMTILGRDDLGFEYAEIFFLEDDLQMPVCDILKDKRVLQYIFREGRFQFSSSNLHPNAIEIIMKPSSENTKK